MSQRKFKVRSKRTGKFKSKLEALVAKQLGKRGRYEYEKLQYFLPKRYIPDFVIIDKKTGVKKYIEVKGYFRYEDQVKMKAVKFSNPDLDIEMWFPNDNKVHTSNMTNSEWCRKWGFPFRLIHT